MFECILSLGHNNTETRVFSNPYKQLIFLFGTQRPIITEHILLDGIKILKFGMTAEAIMAPGCSSHRETTDVFNENSEKDYYESLSHSEKSTHLEYLKNFR